MQNRKRIQAKNWVFTLNNYTEDDENRLKEMECEWLIYGHETAPETGTRHLQGAICFKGRRDFNALSKLFGWHLEVMRGSPNDSKTYCTKQDPSGYVEKGIMPEDKRKKGGESNKRKWEDAFNAAKDGRMEEIPRDLYIRYKRSFDQIWTENKKDKSMETLNDTDLKDSFLWLWGPTGSGKSHTARRIAKELGCDEPYIKSLNKWWNGYDNQWVTIIEEADPDSCEHLARYFKQWCDKWNFTAEAKGSVYPSIRPRYIIVTSNYDINECFPKEQDNEPLHRRFTEQKIENRTFTITWPSHPEMCQTNVEVEPLGDAGNTIPHHLETQQPAGIEPGDKNEEEADPRENDIEQIPSTQEDYDEDIEDIN